MKADEAFPALLGVVTLRVSASYVAPLAVLVAIAAGCSDQDRPAAGPTSDTAVASPSSTPPRAAADPSEATQPTPTREPSPVPRFTPIEIWSDRMLTRAGLTSVAPGEHGFMSAVMAGEWQGRFATVLVTLKGRPLARGRVTDQQIISGRSVRTIKVPSRPDTLLRFTCGRFRYDAKVGIEDQVLTDEQKTRSMVESILRVPAACDRASQLRAAQLR